MSLQTDLEAAKAEVTRIEAEIAALPSELLGKTETELVMLYHALVTKFFKGSTPISTIKPYDSEATDFSLSNHTNTTA